MKAVVFVCACMLSAANALVASAGMLQPRVRSAPAATMSLEQKKSFPSFKNTQVEQFEAGGEYLFFQGPKPKTGYQEDLPSFFSLENFADLEITPLQIAVTVTGVGSAGVLAFSLLN